MNDLIKFMTDKSLSVKNVAELLDVKAATVRAWRSTKSRPIPKDKFKLLKLLAV